MLYLLPTCIYSCHLLTQVDKQTTPPNRTQTTCTSKTRRINSTSAQVAAEKTSTSKANTKYCYHTTLYPIDPQRHGHFGSLYSCGYISLCRCSLTMGRAEETTVALRPRAPVRTAGRAAKAAAARATRILREEFTAEFIFRLRVVASWCTLGGTIAMHLTWTCGDRIDSAAQQNEMRRFLKQRYLYRNPLNINIKKYFLIHFCIYL